MISEQLQNKLDFWEKCYFSLDEPVPFKKDLMVYPALVKDYYKFYSCFPCFTMDKNVKIDYDENGKQIKISNPKGIGMSNLAYLIDMMQDEKVGGQIGAQFLGMMEIIFHIKNGYFCPNCGKDENKFEDIKIELDKRILEEKIKNDKDSNIEKIKRDYFFEISKCKNCGCQKREIISIKNEGQVKKISIYNTEITPKDFDELKALVARQNILDYDGDKYIDPDLKEELEIKARMQNKDYTAPSLEKQMVCVCTGTGYTLKELKEIPIRKLSLLLKTVDAKASYYAQVQGIYSGMVKFKKDPKHWIFDNNKKNIADEFTSLENFEKKFEKVT